MSQGLNQNFSSMDFNVYGSGLYMATDAKLSAKYCTPDDNGVCRMLLVLNLIGKCGVREPLVCVEVESEEEHDLKRSMDAMGICLTQPQHRNPPLGCQSSTGPNHKEVVIYNSAQTLPSFLVEFKVLNEKMPNPYSEDYRRRHKKDQTNIGCKPYLKALPDVVPLFDSNISEGRLHIYEDAKLLPTGTFPVSREEARALRKKVAAGEWNNNIFRSFSDLKKKYEVSSINENEAETSVGISIHKAVWEVCESQSKEIDGLKKESAH